MKGKGREEQGKGLSGFSYININRCIIFLLVTKEKENQEEKLDVLM